MPEMKKIDGYDNYLISKNGVVYSIKNKIDLRQYTYPSGYATVRLCKNGRTKNLLVHKLVAKAFLDNPNKCKYVFHKNGNKKDNRAENLEWYSKRKNRKVL